jgi:UDP-N-acetylglucosamine--N-acetylmuramyl-(pentapeptide) pyrophosphoryl-undecaprenol N-acetylglucosamine transferase
VVLARAGWSLTHGIAASLRLVRRVKPAAVVGFGGYPAFPPLVAAHLGGVPTALHEQNAVLGRANRALARYVTAIATSFEQTKFLDGRTQGKARTTGNPVRDLVVAWAAQRYQPPPAGGPYNLLVFGGSQGASFFADALPETLALVADEVRSRLSVVQQCRVEDLGRVKEAYWRAGVRALVATFFPNLPEEMAKAHLVIARAGASTAAELTVMGRPAILVPLPHALDNDQLQNALRLSDAGAAWCLEQKNYTPEFLAGALADLLTSPDRLTEAATAAKAQGRPDAVTRLADLVDELVGHGPQSA